MAVTLTSLKIAKGADNVGALATVDGLTEARFRGIDEQYIPTSAGHGVEVPRRDIVLFYTPAGMIQDSVIDWWAHKGRYITVEWSYRAEGADQTRVYKFMKVKDIQLVKAAANVDTWQILLRQDKDDLVLSD
jgi:hypothetical protein